MSEDDNEVLEQLINHLRILKPLLLKTGSIHRRTQSRGECYVLRFTEPIFQGKRPQRSITLGSKETADAVAEVLIQWRQESVDISDDDETEAQLDAMINEIDIRFEKDLNRTLKAKRVRNNRLRYSVRGAMY